MTEADMLALVERCEQATGPDRELDSQIADVRWPNVNWQDRSRGTYLDTNGITEQCPRYTASLDAAMTLVPEGCKVVIEIASYQRAAWINREGDPVRSAFAQTPALALCAAALRATKDREAGR